VHIISFSIPFIKYYEVQYIYKYKLSQGDVSPNWLIHNNWELETGDIYKIARKIPFDKDNKW
jgi:hypothetical protein